MASMCCERVPSGEMAHTHNVHNNCIYPPLHITFRNISAETIPHFVSHSGMLATKKISDHQHKNKAAYRKGERVRREKREERGTPNARGQNEQATMSQANFKGTVTVLQQLN